MKKGLHGSVRNDHDRSEASAAGDMHSLTFIVEKLVGEWGSILHLDLNLSLLKWAVNMFAFAHILRDSVLLCLVFCVRGRARKLCFRVHFHTTEVRALEPSTSSTISTLFITI